MTKTTIPVTDLQDVGVSRVSLVGKAATRIPFRITKSEKEPMLDIKKGLASIFNKSLTSGVYMVVVDKNADLDSTKKALEESDLNFNTPVVESGFVSFTQPGVDEFDTAIIKMSEEVSLVVSGISKGLEVWNFEDTSFGTVMASESFYPSLNIATDMLMSTIGNIMSNAHTPTEAAALVSKAVDDYKGYVATLSAAIPEQAFKVDALLKSSATPVDPGMTKSSEEETGMGDEPGDVVDDLDAGAVDELGAVECTVTDSSAEIVEKDSEVDPSATSEEVSALGDALSAMKKDLAEGLLEVKEFLNSQLGSVSKDLSDLSNRVVATEKSLGGTVLVEPTTDKVNTIKREPVSAPPLLDTGFSTIN